MLNCALNVDSEDAGLRIDKWLSEQTDIDLTRSAVAKLIEADKVFVNGKAVSKSYKIQADDVVDVEIPDPVESSVLPEDIHLDIVYEDSYLLVVNKPQGMVVHPAAGNYTGCLLYTSPSPRD